MHDVDDTHLFINTYLPWSYVNIAFNIANIDSINRKPEIKNIINTSYIHIYIHSYCNCSSSSLSRSSSYRSSTSSFSSSS